MTVRWHITLVVYLIHQSNGTRLKNWELWTFYSATGVLLPVNGHSVYNLSSQKSSYWTLRYCLLLHFFNASRNEVEFDFDFLSWRRRLNGDVMFCQDFWRRHFTIEMVSEEMEKKFCLFWKLMWIIKSKLEKFWELIASKWKIHRCHLY